MAILGSGRTSGPYVGNGLTKLFAFDFRVFAKEDVRVVLTSAAGIEAEQALDVEFSVSLNQDQDIAPGGNVTMVRPPAAGERLTIASNVANTQSVTIANAGGFYPQVINMALDRLTVLVQQVADSVGRTIKFPVSDGVVSEDGAVLPNKELRKGKLVAFNYATGDIEPGPSASSVFVAEFSDNIDTVAASIANVNAVGASIASVNAVSGSIANVNSVSGNSSNINTVAANIASVNSVAANISNVVVAQSSAVYAANSAAQAEASRLAAEAARDSAIIQAGVYVDEPTGRAAVSNGQAFKVQGSGTVAAYEYRRVDSATSTLIATYPAISYIAGLRESLHTGGLALYKGSGTFYPLLSDAVGTSLMGYDSAASRLVGAGLIGPTDVQGVVERDVFAPNNVATYIGSGPIYPILTDQIGQVLLGYNSDTNTIVGGVTVASGAASLVALASPPIAKAINHLLFYGQSLCVGATATTLLSTSQPYSNITFNGGPRAWNGSSFTFSPSKPLVEDAVSPAPDGGTNRGETPCSGAANFATTLAITQNGKAASDHVILASTAGHGGYRIDQLNKGTSWYSTALLPHISGGKALNSDYALHAVAWVQGENDNGVSDYTTYRGALSQLQLDVETDAKAISGQTSPVYFITYQMSYGIKTSTAQAFAQLDLAQKNSKFFMASPTYHLPHYASDGTHLTNVGYKWLGAYFGRAYKQLAIDGKAPKFLNPISATRRGAVIRVRFDPPTPPVVLDTSTLAATTDYGFKVLDGASTAAISSVSASSDEVVITLASAPTGVVKVRYALDYLAPGLVVLNGASGNVRDSTSDRITISSISYPLYHVSPHFEMTVTALGE